MTVRTNAIQICDRCLKPFQEKTLKAGDEVPSLKQFGILITQTSGTTKDPAKTSKVLVSFEDVCPTCQGAIETLVARIKMDGGDGRSKKNDTGNGKKRTKTTKAPEAPKVEEYIEKPATEAAKGEEVVESTSGAAPDIAVAGPEKESANEKPAEPPKVESSEAVSEALPDNAVRDDTTGDVYDTRTGEVLRKGSDTKMPF